MLKNKGAWLMVGVIVALMFGLYLVENHLVGQHQSTKPALTAEQKEHARLIGDELASASKGDFVELEDGMLYRVNLIVQHAPRISNSASLELLSPWRTRIIRDINTFRWHVKCVVHRTDVDYSAYAVRFLDQEY